MAAEDREAVMNGLSDYAVSGVGDVKRLQGTGFLRLSFGRFRAIFDEDRNTILTIQIGKRETTTYRRLP